VRLAEALYDLAERAVAATSDRVRTGGASPVEAARARIDASRAMAARSIATHTLAARRSHLAALWGSGTPDFGRVVGDLRTLPPLPSLAELRAAAQASPVLARHEAEIEEREAGVALARSNRIPDVTVGAGGRYFNDVKDGAVVFEVTVPLPVFDRNQGTISEAEARLAKARAERDAVRTETAASMESLHAQLAGAREQAALLARSIVPEAQHALEGTLEGFRQGLVGLGDVLHAQRTAFELRHEEVDTLERAHLLAAELARLTTLRTPNGQTEGVAP
jgi:cobalt-zinc-cadmium efflux system outer membrane protein